MYSSKFFSPKIHLIQKSLGNLFIFIANLILILRSIVKKKLMSMLQWMKNYREIMMTMLLAPIIFCCFSLYCACAGCVYNIRDSHSEINFLFFTLALTLSSVLCHSNHHHHHLILIINPRVVFFARTKRMTHLVLPSVQIHHQVLRFWVLVTHFAFITMLVGRHFIHVKC